MNKTKDPAQRPGDGARAFDTIHEQFTAKAKEFQQAHDWSKADYYEEMTLILAFMNGYSGETSLKDAFKVVSELVCERRGIR